MRNDYDVSSHGFKRRTPQQLEVLEKFYSKENYPSHESIDDLASSLDLTYKQVRGWFIEKRRRDKSNGIIPSINKPKPQAQTERRHNGGKNSSLNYKMDLRKKQSKIRKQQQQQEYQKVTVLQRIMPPDYILKKVFRKDGPILGFEFDSLPAGAFRFSTSTGPKSSLSMRKAPKRRKVTSSSSIMVDSQVRPTKSVPMTKHGMGKGLMTVWRATNPGAGEFPTGENVIDRESIDKRLNPTLADSRRPVRQKIKRLQHNIPVAKQPRRPVKKVLAKKKRAIKPNKVASNKAESKNSHQAECKLALEVLGCRELSNALVQLVDDEELELRELQAGPNPLTCSGHIASNGMHGCSLCKDLLARFPPHSVKMTQPLSMQPWVSSTELVKKLFKVFRFLYTHATTIDVCPFTLDEFAQAFHDKDSLLLGKIHMDLLKLLLSDVEVELSYGYFPHASKDYRFLAFLNEVKREVSVLEMWSTSLNVLTWTEILRQVMVAAGFSSKQSAFQREPLNKEESRILEYGLSPGTLKGELFSILSEQGNNGLKIQELAKSFRVVDLHLMKTTEELELLISSTLSSDISLFEKISSSAYRVRINPLTEKRGKEGLQSDSENSGSVDDDSGDNTTDSSGDESEMALESTSLSIIKNRRQRRGKSDTLHEYTEIDESFSGEAWALALMEGEYSDLSIEEKLSTLVALVDLLSAASSIRMEGPPRVTTESVPSVQHHGGGKIKRSSSLLPVNSSLPLKQRRKENVPKKNNVLFESDGTKGRDTETIEKVEKYSHPMQSICLGSDRRFNSYWIFLGPCNGKDPGHRRIYFESSEDGHWEVIDTKEALCSLLSVLDGRGMREACLLASLEKRESFLCEAMSTKIADDSNMRPSNQSSSDIISSDGSSPISDVDNNLSLPGTVNEPVVESGCIVIEIGRRGEEQKRKWDRLQALDAWIWKSFYSNLNAVKLTNRPYLDSLARCASCHDLHWRDEKHCRICHTTFELDFDLEEKYAIHVATCREKEGSDMFPKHKVFPSQVQVLKAALHAIEAAMPKEALITAWTTSNHKLWVMRLRRTSSLLELLQVLTDFVGAINEDWLCQSSIEFGSDSALNDLIAFFPTLPQTTSAVALWLVKLDVLIAPYLERALSEKTKERNTKRKGKDTSNRKVEMERMFRELQTDLVADLQGMVQQKVSEIIASHHTTSTQPPFPVSSPQPECKVPIDTSTDLRCKPQEANPEAGRPLF